MRRLTFSTRLKVKSTKPDLIERGIMIDDEHKSGRLAFWIIMAFIVMAESGYLYLEIFGIARLFRRILVAPVYMASLIMLGQENFDLLIPGFYSNTILKSATFLIELLSLSLPVYLYCKSTTKKRKRICLFIESIVALWTLFALFASWLISTANFP